MPHHRKYVPHSGGIAAWPSRANRSMVSYASHGFSSRLSRSARSALLSFASLTLVSAKNKAGRRIRSAHPAFVFVCDLSPRRCPAHSATYRSGTSTHDLQRAHLAATRPVADSTLRIALRMMTSVWPWATTFSRQTGHRPSWVVADAMAKLYIPDRNCQEYGGVCK